jgi:GNAT superfamily N-acetyltransferase
MDAVDTLAALLEVSVDPAVRTHLTDVLHTAVELHEHPSHQAWVILSPPNERLNGVHQSCLVALDASQPTLIAWATERVQALHPRVDHRFMIRLRSAYHGMIPALLEHGFCLRRVHLAGTTEDALRAVQANPGPTPASRGVAFEPLQAADVPTVNAMLRDFFTANLALSFLNEPMNPVAQAKLDAAMTTKLLAMAQLNPPQHFVVRTELGIEGHFGVVERNGVDMMLQPRLHGRGLGRAMYTHLVHAAHTAGVRSIVGATSNPAVMRMGRQLGRHPSHFLIGKGSTGLPWPLPTDAAYPSNCAD